MAVNVKSLTTAGLAELWYGAMVSGVFTGPTATPPDAGVTQDMSGLTRLYNIQEFPFVPEAPDIVQVPGDDGVAAQFQFNATALPNGVMTLGSNDDDFQALAMGLVTDAEGDAQFMLINNTNVVYQDLILVSVSQAKDRATGAAHYFGYLALNVNAFYLGHAGLSGRTDGSFQYQISGNKATKYPWGVSFTDVINGDTEAVVVQYSKPYRPMLDVSEGDGIVTDFNLSQAIAADTANNVQAWVAGVAQTWVTGVPGAGEFGITEATPDVCVFGTAPADSATVHVFYGRE
jgi:hypothetical protein